MVGQGQNCQFEKMLSAQYLETTSLESSQTWYSECLYRLDDTYRYSVHMVKGQGQNCRNLYKWCLLNIFGLLCMKVSKLATVDAPRQEMSLFDFLVTMSRSRSNCFALMLSSQCLKLLLLVS